MAERSETAGGARHVAFFLLWLRIAGAERNMLTVIRHMAAEGYRVDVVLIQAVGEFLEKLPPEVRVVDLASRRKIAALPGLVRYLRLARPRVLVSAMASVNCIAALAVRLSGVRLRHVMSERSTLSMEVGRSRLMRVLPWAMRRLYPRADAIWAVSRGVADDLAAVIGLARDRIEVIYNPVVTELLLAEAEAPLDDPWFAPGAPPVVLAVNRLHAQKDFPTLIAAFAKLRAGRECRLLILGEGEERARLEALAAATGYGADIRMPGETPNPYPYMRAASVYALSSAWEGLSTSLIEAMACGAPVVSTDCPSGPREILEDGRLGPLVAVGDVDALAAALAARIDAPRPVAYPLERFTAGAALRQCEAIIWPAEMQRAERSGGLSRARGAATS